MLGKLWLCVFILATSCTDNATLVAYLGPYWAELSLFRTDSTDIRSDL